MSNKQLWAIVVASAVVALFCALFPMYVIRPFRAQGLSELHLVLLVMRIRPVLTLLCLAATALAVVRLWSCVPKHSARAGLSGALLAACLAAVAARVNIFEMMFHPIGQPAFESAAQAQRDPREMVLAIRPGGIARAYPIRPIAYHHIVNDVVGGLPIVATD